MNNSTILAETDNSEIVQFKACGHIGIRYNNTLMSFTQNHFEDFVTTYSDIDFFDYAIIFPDDKKRLIMNSPTPSVQLCFLFDEFNNFKELLAQATIILRANSIINI